MSIYYQDESATLYHGDCRELTDWLDADVLVTDPPYGRAWRQGDLNKPYGWRVSSHSGIANDASTGPRDEVLALWGDRQAVVFGDLMLPPPVGVKHVLIFDKSNGNGGMHGAIAGFRRDAEGIYLLGRHPSGIGGSSAILRSDGVTGSNLTRRTGHPHTKPVDLMAALIGAVGGAVVADPFAGSGSTLVAAKQLGRKAIGVELEERYCEVIAKRLAQGVLDFGEPA